MIVQAVIVVASVPWQRQEAAVGIRRCRDDVVIYHLHYLFARERKDRDVDVFIHEWLRSFSIWWYPCDFYKATLSTL